jgi:hypothetical protein
MSERRWWEVVAIVGVACALFSLASAGECRAASKEECLDSHGRGQDLRDQGRLTVARQTFLACAQSSCPPLIQADCSRYGEELDRLVPTVSFAARDPEGADLPDTAVYVDDQIVATRLDDGKSYDLDPGKHVVRFAHGGRETTVTVVLNQGEKGRSVLATFADAAVAARAMPALPPSVATAKRPIAPLLVAGLGAAAAVAGGVLMVVGIREVPSNCSIGSRQCTAAPGDPSFGEAHSGLSLANVGLGVGIGGAAVLVGGVVWYLLEPARLPAEPGRATGLAPWFGDRAGGLSFSGRY